MAPLNYLLPFLTNTAGRDALKGVSSYTQGLIDSYNNPTNDNTPVSPGWNAAVEAQKTAVKNGTQLPPRGPDVPVDRGNGGGDGGSAAPTTTGRQSKRTGPGGVEQTGTQTGVKPMTMEDVNSALGRIGSNRITNPYSSNNLPATQDYEVPNTGGETPKQYSAEDILVAGYRMGGGDDTGAQQIAAGFNMGGGNDANKGEVPIDSNLAKGIAAGKEVDTGATPDQTSGLAAALADKESMRFKAPEKNGIGAAYAPPTVIDAEEIQRRRSFLDADNSMQGLRNIEADQGIYVAEGKYYHVNPNAGKEGQNDFINISKEQRDGIMRGGEGAEQLRKSFVDRINDKGSETPAAPEASEKFAPAPQILETPERRGGDETKYFETPTGSTVESGVDFTDPPKVDMNGEEDYRALVDKVKGNPYLR